MKLTEKFHIFKTDDGKYVIGKVMRCGETITNKVIASFDKVEEAHKFCEDVVPANSIAVGANIATFDPLLRIEKRRKRLLRRFAPMLAGKGITS